jgi:dissimilatory sulfite reductase (desulfoviridin) alpha/beta subunit
MFGGGNSGRKPMIGEEIVNNISQDEVIKLMDNIFIEYIKHDTKKRWGHLIIKLVLEILKKNWEFDIIILIFYLVNKLKNN